MGRVHKGWQQGACRLKLAKSCCLTVAPRRQLRVATAASHDSVRPSNRAKSSQVWATSVLTVGAITLHDLHLSRPLTPSVIFSRAIFAVIVTFVEEAAHPVIEKAISPEPKLHEDRTANEMAQLELTDTEMERVGDALLTQAAHVVAERDPDKMVLLQQELEITARKHQVKGLITRHMQYLALARTARKNRDS